MFIHYEVKKLIKIKNMQLNNLTAIKKKKLDQGEELVQEKVKLQAEDIKVKSQDQEFL